MIRLLRIRSILLGVTAICTLAAFRIADPVKAGAVADHVIIISVDGLRADAIEKYNLNTMGQLAREGATSLTAQTIFPSKTLPSHTSMLTGMAAANHGVTWNSDRTAELGTIDTPTIFERAKDAGFTTAAFFSKSKFRHLQKAGTLDFTQAPTGIDLWMATKTVEDVLQYLRWNQPNLLFVHIAEPDFAGHSIGWNSFAYRWGVRRADAAVAQILGAADRAFGRGKYTVILTADHGGHGRSHGTDNPEDMTIPLIVWGKSVQPGELTGLHTMDTAATALWLLGVPLPEELEGVAISDAFTAAGQLAACGAQMQVKASH